MAGRPVDEARAQQVVERLRSAAGPNGFLEFDRFQEISLYAAGVGYYEAHERTLGRSGDFYTAAHASPLFGATIARRVRDEIERLGRPARFRIAELGPGDGTLARDLLAALRLGEKSGTEVEYLLVERSGALRARAVEALASSPFAGRVRASDSLGADGPFDGIVLANELLDAQPARRLRRTSSGWLEVGAQWDGRRFVEDERPPSRPLPEGLPDDVAPATLVEVSPAAEALVREVADALAAGSALLLDYGGTEEELVRGHAGGTLQAIRGHRVLDDPYDAPGFADLSTFVNFDRIRAAARRTGLGEVAYERQTEALARWGFEAALRDAVAAAANAEEEVRLRLGAKNLLFGFESFHVLELASGPARSSTSPSP